MSRIGTTFIKFVAWAARGFKRVVRTLGRIQHENLEHHYLRRIFEESGETTFLQIGAHDGKTLDPMYRYLTTTECSGVMVEPVPWLFARLVANYKPFPMIRCENCVISDHDGTTSFYTVREDILKSQPEWGDMLGSLSREQIVSHRDLIPDVEDYIEEQQLPCLTVRSLLQKYGLNHVDVVLIDVEGYDYEVLKQVDLRLLGVKVIIFENVHLSKGDRRAAERYLTNANMRVRRFNLDTIGVSREWAGWSDVFFIAIRRVLRRLNGLPN